MHAKLVTRVWSYKLTWYGVQHGGVTRWFRRDRAAALAYLRHVTQLCNTAKEIVCIAQAEASGRFTDGALEFQRTRRLALSDWA